MNFLRKFSFFNYFSAVTRAPVMRNSKFATVFAGYFVLIVSIFFSTPGSNGGAFFVAFIASFIFVATLTMGIYFDKSPNIATIMPLSCRREAVYRFLSALLMAALMVFAIMIAALIIGLIVFIFASIPSCSEVEDEVEIVETVAFSMGAYGGIFSAAYLVLSYSAGMISNFIKKNKNRVIFLVGYCAAVLIGFILIGVPYRQNPVYKESGLFIGSPFIQATYEAMGAPWLCTVFVCLVAAGMLAAAIYLAIRYCKEKKSY